jgi:hydrogenase expression/formation protein HypE
MSDHTSSMQCPIPINEYPHIVMGHGGGGRLTHQLIQKMFAPVFKNEFLTGHDGAVLPGDSRRIAISTDSYVIHPLFFPGGDIGKLSVYGTVNDLAMCGAEPKFISLAFILEEGLLMETLWSVVQSIQASAEETGVKIVTGDTKVVERNKGDGIYINTTGIGWIPHSRVICPESIRPGDSIILSGDIGRHGMAIMARREGLEFESALESDCAPLHRVVMELLNQGVEIHCLRDLTRGGLASALIEIVEQSGFKIIISNDDIPVMTPVQSACALLGLDPLFVANEGRFICFVPDHCREKALNIIRHFPVGAMAVVIGEVTDVRSAVVVEKNSYGGKRVLQMFSGEQLPRIC